MTILRDLSILWSLFHILVLFMLLYRSRYPKRSTVILTVVFMGTLALLNVAGLVRYGAEFMGQVFLLTCTLPSLFFFWFMSQDKKGAVLLYVLPCGHGILLDYCTDEPSGFLLRRAEVYPDVCRAARAVPACGMGGVPLSA